MPLSVAEGSERTPVIVVVWYCGRCKDLVSSQISCHMIVKHDPETLVTSHDYPLLDDAANAVSAPRDT